MESGYIYFVHADGTNRYKIGLTVDLDRRMKQLNGKQAPFENKLLWSIKVSDMRSAERDLHDTFSSRRVNGEWFTFNANELDEVKGKYNQTSKKYSIPQYQPKPSHREQHDYSGYEVSFSNVLWVGAGIVAIVSMFLTSFRPSHGTEMQKNSATAITVHTNRVANVRAVPNGQILCVLPESKSIEVSSGDNNGWHDTDACGDSGVIHESVIKP